MTLPKGAEVPERAWLQLATYIVTKKLGCWQAGSQEQLLTQPGGPRGFGPEKQEAGGQQQPVLPRSPRLSNGSSKTNGKIQVICNNCTRLGLGQGITLHTLFKPSLPLHLPIKCLLKIIFF